jgi:TM2 domain-containing membrane protein YozV
MAHAQPNAQIPPTESQKSRGIALICVLLFGALGVHEFYVGRVMAGLIMLALFIMFIASLIDLGLDPNLIFVFGIVMLSWIIVDLVKILLGLYKDRYGLRLKRWSF